MPKIDVCRNCGEEIFQEPQPKVRPNSWMDGWKHDKTNEALCNNGKTSAFPMPKKLKFGERPWSHLSRKELIRLLDTAYAALVPCNGVIHRESHGEEGNPYWVGDGLGGDAKKKSDIAIEKLRRGYEDEDICRAYFRYADCLLFDDFDTWFTNWHICPKCKRMIANGPGNKERKLEGLQCGDTMETDCKGKLRRITWKDIEPKV